jgi:hypothetical protein
MLSIEQSIWQFIVAISKDLCNAFLGWRKLKIFSFKLEKEGKKSKDLIIKILPLDNMLTRIIMLILK